MNTFRKSPTGWVLLAAYLILAGLLFREALTCKDWACDLVALIPSFPLGFLIAWLYNGIDYLFVLDLASGSLRKWYFILPTVLANAIFYFWVGWQVEKMATRLRRRSAAQR